MMRFSGKANLPTRFGTFRVMAVEEGATRKEHLVLTRGELEGERGVPVRLHSECLTGDVMGSLRCDCRAQLEKSLEFIDREGRGMLVYLRQEGRGIGLMNKIRAYFLQEQGYDTVEANERLGFQDDHREYGMAIEIIRALGIESIALITNNPEKILAMKQGGVHVTHRIPLVTSPNEFNESYLKTKEVKLGHLSADEKETSPEQDLPPRRGGWA